MKVASILREDILSNFFLGTVIGCMERTLDRWCRTDAPGAETIPPDYWHILKTRQKPCAMSRLCVMAKQY